jgi:hypothetical protein
MVVCYALERRSHWFILGFAVSCALGSVYGFLQGAWPFGAVEAVWCVIAALGRRQESLVLPPRIQADERGFQNQMETAEDAKDAEVLVLIPPRPLCPLRF